MVSSMDLPFLTLSVADTSGLTLDSEQLLFLCHGDNGITLSVTLDDLDFWLEANEENNQAFVTGLSMEASSCAFGM